MHTVGFGFVFNEVFDFFKEYLLEQNFVKVKSVLAKSGRCSSAAYISEDCGLLRESGASLGQKRCRFIGLAKGTGVLSGDVPVN